MHMVEVELCMHVLKSNVCIYFFIFIFYVGIKKFDKKDSLEILFNNLSDNVHIKSDTEYPKEWFMDATLQLRNLVMTLHHLYKKI